MAIAQQLTVEELFHQPGLLAQPPENIAWSPDSRHLIYLGDQGDLMEAAATEPAGGTRVLVSRDKMQVFNEPARSEWDRERRARYHEPVCVWAPDSKHLLFDSNGEIWFFDPANGTGLQLASTGAGSGDNPQLSPDGAYLSYIRDHNLYLHRFAQSDLAVKLTDSPTAAIWNGDVDWVYEEELAVRSNYFWSPDSKHLAYLQMNESQIPRYPMEDWDSEHAKVVGQFYPQPGDPNPAVRVGVVGVGGGKTKWLDIPLDSGNDYIPRFGWLDAKTLWVETLTRNQKHLAVYFADIATGGVQTAFTKSDNKFLEASYDLTVLPGNLLVTGWKDGHEHIYLYSFDAANPLSGNAKLVKQLTSGDWEVAKICGVDSDTHTIYYLSNEGDPRQQQIWAVKMDGSGNHRVSASTGWHDPVFSPNAKFFADTASSITTPPVVELCRNETRCHTVWKAPSPGVDLRPPIPLKLKAADHVTTLYGQLILPAGDSASAPPHSIPLIMNPYGGPEAQTVTDEWEPRTLLFDQILAQHGFAVLRVDNRGMGGRGRDFAQAAYGDFGKVQFADQSAALDQVLAQYPQLDPARLGWWGWSWGGTFTLYAMTHSDHFRAGVAVAPVTDWRDYDSIYTERYLGDPDSNPDVYREASVVNSASHLSGRLLLAHGTSDYNVHFENSVQFIQRLIGAGIPYDLQIFPGKTHSIDSAEARTELYRRILGQFERYVMNASPNRANNQTKGEEKR